MPKVLIADKMSPAAAAVFRTRGIDCDERTDLAPDALKTCLGDYEGLAIRSSTKATADVLAVPGRLKVIGRAGIGVDNVDLAAATAQGIVVMNTPFGNSITTAEHALALMMSLARQIPQANTSTHAGKWEKSRFIGAELYGKTLGLIGCGNIGAIVADRARGLKMRVIAHDPFLSAERARDIGVERVDLPELYRRADIISLHVPKTDSTVGMINAAALAQMKPGVRIVNCARGGLIVEADLKAALDAGEVSGAALDVFAEEPARENPLFGHPRVICTPHLGASTTEAQENVALQVAEQMADYLTTGAVTNALNMPSVSAEEAPILGPYLKLAEQLGAFAGQITETGISAVELEYAGHVATLNTKPITAVALAGLMRPVLETVNMVSAPALAKERGIRISEVKREQAGSFQTAFRLTVETERRRRSIGGTLFDGERPRLVDIEGVPLEAEVSAHMLFLRNLDRPGLIGRLGSVLGDAGVNIASFHLGRQAEGEQAVALVAVDQPVPDAVVQTVCGLPNVVSLKALKLPI